MTAAGNAGPIRVRAHVGERTRRSEEIATALLGGGVTGVNALALLSSDLLGATGRQIGLDACASSSGDVVRDEFREDPSALLQDDDEPGDPADALEAAARQRRVHAVAEPAPRTARPRSWSATTRCRTSSCAASRATMATQGVGIRHQMTFGGDPCSGSARPPVEAVTVVEVLLEGSLAPFTDGGDPPGPEGEGRRALRLLRLAAGPGQSDGPLHGARALRGARARPSRRPSASDAVDVVYSVTPGPATRVQVDGFDMPKDELDRHSAVVVARRFRSLHRGGRRGARASAPAVPGFVNGVVTGSMESSGEFKTLHLTVVPGTPVGSREHALHRQRRRQPQRAGSGGAAVRDRGARLDRSRHPGRRRSRPTTATRATWAPSVTVEEPVLENGQGRAAGDHRGRRRARRSARCHWSGLSEAQAAAVQRAAALEARSALHAGGAQCRARARGPALSHAGLQHRAGDGNGRARSTTAPQVDMNLSIVEGPQQVLQDVETVGRDPHARGHRPAGAAAAGRTAR